MKRSKSGPEMSIELDEITEQLKAGTVNHETAQGYAALMREKLRIKKLQIDIVKLGGGATAEMLDWVGRDEP